MHRCHRCRLKEQVVPSAIAMYRGNWEMNELIHLHGFSLDLEVEKGSSFHIINRRGTRGGHFPQIVLVFVSRIGSLSIVQIIASMFWKLPSCSPTRHVHECLHQQPSFVRNSVSTGYAVFSFKHLEGNSRTMVIHCRLPMKSIDELSADSIKVGSRNHIILGKRRKVEWNLLSLEILRMWVCVPLSESMLARDRVIRVEYALEKAILHYKTCYNTYAAYNIINSFSEWIRFMSRIWISGVRIGIPFRGWHRVLFK